MTARSPARLQLLRAVKTGNEVEARRLLDLDQGLVRAEDADGSTLLHHAAWKGHAAVAALLLDRGADVNARSRNEHYGDTPLHAAAHADHAGVAQLLLDRGADRDAVSINGRTPLQETAIHNARRVAKLLS